MSYTRTWISKVICRRLFVFSKKVRGDCAFSRYGGIIYNHCLLSFHNLLHVRYDINVREYRRVQSKNDKSVKQVTKTKKNKTQDNAICVGQHYAQTNS